MDYEYALKDYPDVLTIEHIQKILSIGRSKAYALIKNGSIRYFRLGRQIRIPKAYLLDFITDRCYHGNMQHGNLCCQEGAVT